MGSYFTSGRLFAAVLLAATCVAGETMAADKGNPEASRIVSIGGTITEILYALGAEDRIVARDSTSFYPDAANAKPDVGYMRQLSAEGILGQNDTSRAKMIRIAFGVIKRYCRYLRGFRRYSPRREEAIKSVKKR